MTKPNIFRYGRSELSQDAMICWLLDWARSENVLVDKNLFETGTRFLNSIFLLFQIDPPKSYLKIVIHQQFQSKTISDKKLKNKKIDVLCLVNDRYALIIEDKTNSGVHSNQLENYKRLVEADFPHYELLPIYFKTGDQGDFYEVDSAGYKKFLRKEIIKTLSIGYDRHNNILNDYLERLESIEDKVEMYKTLAFKDWKAPQWKGFYRYIQDNTRTGASWGYVNNKSDPFWGYWWNVKTVGSLDLYFQIFSSTSKTPSKICIRLSNRINKVPKFEIEKWLSNVQGKIDRFTIEKPNKLGSGKTVTIANIRGEFFVTNEQGVILINETIKNIYTLEQYLNKKIN